MKVKVLRHDVRHTNFSFAERTLTSQKNILTTETLNQFFLAKLFATTLQALNEEHRENKAEK